ncbi:MULTISPECIES: hypothetical protein [Rhodocyclales]|jgi:hypothetical protein|uniref:hypothetical protein n=1 Tax=Rhodocyclales TaxID=206389 RepID=UPI00067DC15F|nr:MULTISPECIES: hypothetical protein [Rhodocyclales]MCQ6963967.1 hypothetical protein [Aromatoleum toluolicum]
MFLTRVGGDRLQPGIEFTARTRLRPCIPAIISCMLWKLLSEPMISTPSSRNGASAAPAVK